MIGDPKPKRKKKTSKAIIPQRVQNEVRDRSEGVCEHHPHDGCTYFATDFAHKLARSYGGKHTADNIEHLCRTRHLQTEKNQGRDWKAGIYKHRGE